MTARERRKLLEVVSRAEMPSLYDDVCLRVVRFLSVKLSSGSNIQLLW